MVEHLKAENQILWSKLPKRECLDFFVVFEERHLRHLLSCWLDYYHRFRPHQGLGSVLLKHYQRKAA